MNEPNYESLTFYSNQFRRCHVVGNYPILIDKHNKGRLIQQVDQHSLIAAELFHEVCQYYSLPSMYINSFDTTYDIFITLRQPYFDSFSCKKWLSYKSQPLYEFLKWGIIKYLIGMNGHRRENIYFQEILEDKLFTKLTPWRHSITLPGNKILQDLTILGNACPEIKAKLRSYYLSGCLNSILSIVDNLKVCELIKIFDKFHIEDAEYFITKKANKFYYQFYKELDLPWLSKDEFLLDPNKPQY